MKNTTKATATKATVSTVQNKLSALAAMQAISKTRATKAFNLTLAVDMLAEKYANASSIEKALLKAAKKIGNACTLYPVSETAENCVIVLHKLNVTENFIENNKQNSELFIITKSTAGKNHAWLIITVSKKELLEASAKSNKVDITTLTTLEIENSVKNSVHANVEKALAK